MSASSWQWRVPASSWLPPGFCATIFADDLGHTRHMVVAPDGVLYVNTWSGRYFPNAPPPPGGFLIALKDTKGEGRADVVQRFGVTVEAGGTGGSGIALYHDGTHAPRRRRAAARGSMTQTRRDRCFRPSTAS